MGSGARRKAAAVEWADLPAELLGIISGGLGNPRETVGFRSVCQSWRFSIPPPPNKLSPLLPTKVPFFGSEPYSSYETVIKAGAVYLVRPRSDPSKAWMVSVEEAAAGELVLRHALSFQEINGDAGLDLEADWIAATQTPIARFYFHNKRCVMCKGVDFDYKVVFASEISEGSGCSRQLVGLCSYSNYIHIAFRLDLGGGGGSKATQLTDNKVERHRRIHDYVKFKGRIFAVDAASHIYVLDHTNLQLVQATEKPVREGIKGLVWARFVESDGDLYVVLISSYENTCQVHIYKLVVDCSKVLLVEDLGDRVFFLTQQCSFSISARLLPHPWRQGNCVFFADYARSCCKCAIFVRCTHKSRHRVFHLGSQTFTRLWTPKGHSYSDLFTPPASFVVEEMTGVNDKKGNRRPLLETKVVQEPKLR